MVIVYYNLLDYDFNLVLNVEEMKFGIVVFEWNVNIIGVLLDGVVKILKKYGVKEENILVKIVFGSFEFIFGVNQMMENSDIDVIIIIGCVIKGDILYFDYVCMGVI